MITLTDNELEYALNFQDLIERNGINDLLRIECHAGPISENSFKRVLEYLKQDGWSYIDAVIKADQTLLEELPNCLDVAEEELPQKKISDKILNRRLRNIFTQQEIRQNKMTEMPYEELLVLIQKREKEIENGTFKHF